MIRVFLFLLLGMGVAQSQIWRGLLLDTIPEWKDSMRVWDAQQYESPLQDSLELETSGYKSIRLVTGDQGSEIHQEMRLGIQGEVAPGWFVEARIVDEGVQAGEMRVTTLQQIDEMFLKLQHNHGAITVGNLRYQQDSLGLFGTDHHTLGGMLQQNDPRLGGQWAFGHDPVRRLVSVFPGRDGQRTGYLVAQDGSGFVAVVSGSERVYVNGVRLQAEKDYQFEAVGGVLDFQAILPSNRDQIRVEYEAYGDSYSKGFMATDFHTRWWMFRLDLASVGEWADLKEVRQRTLERDSTDSISIPLETPDDIRLFGGKLRFPLGSWGFASVEGAYSRYDSNSQKVEVPIQEGEALRWTFARNEDWNKVQKGLQYDILGNARSTHFQVKNHQGKVNDWGAWDLRENWELDSLDSLPGARYLQQLRLGYSPDGQWRPWWGAGWRKGEPDFFAQRAELGLDHQNRAVASHMRFSGIQSEQQGKKQRTLAEFSSENKTGYVRPYGTGYAAWRNLETDSSKDTELLDLRSTSGIRYGLASEGFQGSLEIAGQELRRQPSGAAWVDSSNMVGGTHRLEAGNSALGINSLLQWKRIWDPGNTGVGDFWISEQQGHWNYLAHEGRISHRLGLTREHPLIADYRKVAEGTGDVTYDSLLHEWIEGVDRGDWVQDGWVREDSLPMVEQSEVSLQLDEWVSPGILLSIKDGLLRDIRIGFRGDWSRKDTSDFVATPPFRWSNLAGSLDGISLQEGLLQWNQVEQKASSELRSGRARERRWSLSRAEEMRWWQGATGILRLPETWEWEASYDREEVQILAPSPMEWIVQDWYPQLRKEFPRDWHAEFSYRLRYSHGSAEWGALDGRLLQPGVGVWKQWQGGELRVDYSYSQVRMENLQMPWRILNGYSEGWTHRLEARANYRFQERLSLDFNYLWRKEEHSKQPFQKVSGEARAYF